MASSEKAAAMQTSVTHDDDDLDDLLDEFDEQILNKPPGASSAETEDGSFVAGNNKNTGEILNSEFKHNIEDLIKDLNIEDPQAKNQFEQLVKQFEETHMEDAKSSQTPQNFDNVMKDTMERLKKSGENIDEQLKNDPSGSNPEDMLAQLLAGLGDGTGDGNVDVSKLLTDMLEQLSSKEVLYEPIKDLNSKFPEYLKENEGKLSTDDHANYTKQYEVTEKILAVFDAPEYDNDNLEHRENVNSLLESLQELGNPPTELVGDENDFPGFGGGGNAGADTGLDFDSANLPKDLEKNLEEGCKQS